MITIYNPTGKVVRDSDDFGSGKFGASRGSRVHKGTDFISDPGQPIYSPIHGRIVREAKPYANDLAWSGVLIVGEHITIKMFYVKVEKNLIGEMVSTGQVIGTAQNIASKYSKGGKTMKNHVHLQIERVNPEKLLA